MTDWQLTTPVAFLIFNRPETTAKVFAEIARAKPPVLLVVADGPRPDVPGEAEKCAAARAIVEKGVDWACDVRTNYADLNLGCRRRVSSGLDWVFDTVEEAIVLEDDCLPHPTFFRFCEELLERYRHDERIMTVSGINLQFGRKRTEYSYYFSRYFHCWGWASWRRAWKHFDVNMTLWPEMDEGEWLRDILQDPSAVRYWSKIFRAVEQGQIDTWDYPYLFAHWRQGALSLIPAANLVSNIGFHVDATHTRGPSRLANMPHGVMAFPLQHPPFMIRDARADDLVQREFYSRSSFLSRVEYKTARWARTLLYRESGSARVSGQVCENG
jgi:hypothetical protein